MRKRNLTSRVQCLDLKRKIMTNEQSYVTVEKEAANAAYVRSIAASRAQTRTEQPGFIKIAAAKGRETQSQPALSSIEQGYRKNAAAREKEATPTLRSRRIGVYKASATAALRRRCVFPFGDSSEGRRADEESVTASLSGSTNSIYDNDKGKTSETNCEPSTVALANAPALPPSEIVIITSNPRRELPIDRRNESSTRQHSSKQDKNVDGIDAEMKTAHEFALKLVRDLESLHDENERLRSQLRMLKTQQQENFVHRGRLFKALLCASPLFLFCGGLDAFFLTIVLGWVLVEVFSYIDVDGETGGIDDDDDDDDDGSSLSFY